MSDIMRENTHERLEITCPKCNFFESVKYHVVGPFGEKDEWNCVKCGNTTKEIWYYKNENYVEPGKAKCPFCNSTNCKKISAASKVGKVALFGVFAAGSVSKTWHCNNCGSNFG